MKQILQQHKFDGEILEKPRIIDSEIDLTTPQHIVEYKKKLTDKYNSAQTVYELVTMTEFVELNLIHATKDFLNPETLDVVVFRNSHVSVSNYANFITQPLTKEMFIGDGRIFEGFKQGDIERSNKSTIENVIYQDGQSYTWDFEKNRLWSIDFRMSCGEIPKTIEQALNDNIVLLWNGKTI